MFHTGVTISGSPTVTIWNMAQSGISAELISQQISSFSQVDQDVYILSAGYNGGIVINKEWEAFLDTITTYWGSGGNIYLTSQAPKISPETQVKIDSAAYRAQQVIQYAIINGYGYLPVYRAFITDGRDLSSLIDGDGIHPNDDGMAIWEDIVNGSLDVSY